MTAEARFLQSRSSLLQLPGSNVLVIVSVLHFLGSRADCVCYLHHAGQGDNSEGSVLIIQPDSTTGRVNWETLVCAIHFSVF